MATPTRVNIKVTEADIEKARKRGQGDSFNCVVSQTIARTIPDATFIDTDTQTIRFTVDGERRVYLTPYAVQGYVIAFDAGEPLEPFSFQLRDPRRKARKIRTEVGKEADRAATRARKAAKRPVGTSAKVPIPESDAGKAARAAYAEVKAKNPDAPLTESDRSGPKSPPRVFRTKQRSYGHRLLRINQEA